MNNYLIYNKLVSNLNRAPFDATISLFDELNIPYELCNEAKHDIGYELHAYNKINFNKIFQPLFKDDKTIITLENSSHLGILKSKQSDQKVISFLEVLKQNAQTIKSKIEHKFEKFNVGVYMGDNEVDLNKDDISYLLNLTGIKEINLKSIHEPDGYSLLDFNEKISYKMAGKILFDAYDSGCDFLIVNDIRSFNLFDKYQKNIEKTTKRPLGKYGLGVFNISQIILMSIGKVKLEENFTNLHEVKPSFL